MRSAKVATVVIRTLLLTIVLGLMTTAAAAQDLPSDRFGPPLILRLKGVVERTPEAARHTDGLAVVSLGFLGDGAPARRWLGGPADVVAELRDGPPGTTLDIEGLYDDPGVTLPTRHEPASFGAHARNLDESSSGSDRAPPAWELRRPSGMHDESGAVG